MANPYQSYTLEEFASDPDFRNWVLNPSPERDVFWQTFIDNHPEKAGQIEEARNLIGEVHRYFDKGKTDAHLLAQKFEEISHRVDRQQEQLSHKPVIQRFSARYLGIAATVLFLFSLGGWLWISQMNQYEVYSTAYGEWKTVALPDGTTVNLNANSELKVSRNWEAGGDRMVWLTGEAFFEVTKKPVTGAKFFVITTDVSVEVLGTSFNVNSRGKKTEVFLQEGKIRMEAGKEEAYMDPGDFIAYSASSQQMIETRIGVNDLHSSWKDGALIMQEASVGKIFDKIAEIYGIEFQVQDSSFLQSKTTIRIPMDKLEITLPILEKTLGTTIEQHNNRLIIH